MARNASVGASRVTAAPSPPPSDVRTTLRDVERLAFVAVRSIDEGDRDAAREAIGMIRERVRRLP